MGVADGPAGNDTTVEYPPVVETLGKTYESDWSSAAQGEVKRVETSGTQSQSFGDIPAAQDFAAVYRAAQHVYEATLRGIKTDLEAAGAALAQAGAEIRQRDEASADTFQQLNAQWGGGSGFTSTRQHDEAEQQQPVQDGAQAMERLEGDGAVPGDPGRNDPGQGGSGEGGPADPSVSTDPSPAAGQPPADSGTPTDTMPTGGSSANG